MNFIVSSDFFIQILFVKLGKLRQPVTKYIEQSPFANVFASPSSINIDGSENYTEKVLWTNYRPKTMIQERVRGILMELFLSFLRENPNKLCFIELLQNFCDWF